VRQRLEPVMQHNAGPEVREDGKEETTGELRTGRYKNTQLSLCGTLQLQQAAHGIKDIAAKPLAIVDREDDRQPAALRQIAIQPCKPCQHVAGPTADAEALADCRQ